MGLYEEPEKYHFHILFYFKIMYSSEAIKVFFSFLEPLMIKLLNSSYYHCGNTDFLL